MSGWVGTNHRAIIAVGKHIVPEEALASGGVGVCVDESAQGGGVISGLQVVEARFYGNKVAIEAKKWSI